MGKQVVYHQPDGRITAVKYIQDGMEEANATPGDLWFEHTPSCNGVNVYAVAGTVADRPGMPLVISDTEIDVSETVTITGIPVGTLLAHPDGTEIISDGTVEWGSAVPGSFTLIFENFPYRDEVIRVKVY